MKSGRFPNELRTHGPIFIWKRTFCEKHMKSTENWKAHEQWKAHLKSEKHMKIEKHMKSMPEKWKAHEKLKAHAKHMKSENTPLFMKSICFSLWALGLPWISLWISFADFIMNFIIDFTGMEFSVNSIMKSCWFQWNPVKCCGFHEILLISVKSW